MAQRQLKLGAFMRPISIHTGAWRYPGAWPDANFNFGHIKTLIRKLEAGSAHSCHSGARGARARNPSLGSLCGPMDSGLTASRRPGMTGERGASGMTAQPKISFCILPP